jgi:GTPase SAR1 family protein
MVMIIFNKGRVGKTSLLNKYITDRFDDKQDMTINSCYLEKELEINGNKYTSCIWVISMSYILLIGHSRSRKV